jgi:hypothetical protein
VAGPTFAAAPLDLRGRATALGWLVATFAAVAGLLSWSAAGAGTGPLLAAAIVGTVVPIAVLVRLGGLPRALELDGRRLVVHRYLGVGWAVELTEPAVPGLGPLAVRRGWTGRDYACRVRGDRTVGLVYLAVTDPDRAVRLRAGADTALVTPADPSRFCAAVRGRV